MQKMKDKEAKITRLNGLISNLPDVYLEYGQLEPLEDTILGRKAKREKKLQWDKEIVHFIEQAALPSLIRRLLEVEISDEYYPKAPSRAKSKTPLNFMSIKPICGNVRNIPTQNILNLNQTINNSHRNH